MGKFILGFIFIAILASTINNSLKGRSEDAAGAASTRPAELQIVTGKERDEIVAGAVKGLVLERDKIEKVSFYSAKLPRLATRVETYIALPDDKLPYARMKAIYFGDDWIFYDSIKVMVDDQVIYKNEFRRAEVARNNSGGSVWEVADYLANDVELAALNAIANSKSATIRFSGSERRHDHEVTKKERRDIQRVLEAYALLLGQLARKAPKDPDTVPTK